MMIIDQRQGAVKLPELAAAVGIAGACLSRLFQDGLGVSASRFIWEVRLEHAKDMLREPQLSVAEIALSLGFRNEPQFARAFERYSGMTPQLARTHAEERVPPPEPSYFSVGA